MSRVCLVGAGAISRAHADALRGHRITAVADPNLAAARRLAASVGAQAYASVAEALAAGAFDRAHVLVPPPLHAQTALPLLEAGKAVLLEKPLAVSSAECAALQDAARRGGAILGVNQNFIYHPAFSRLRALVDERAFGPPRFVSCLYNVPLRQMAARQFGHWMFAAPGNILLEQAVHPLSQLLIFTGAVQDVQVTADPLVDIAPGVPFCPSASIALRGSRLPGQLRFAVGQEFPFWQVSVICDDGVIVADILANRLIRHGRTRWLGAVDSMVSGLRSAADLAGASVANLARYAASTAKLRGPSDPFLLSMQASIAAFHAAAEAGQPPLADGAFGAELVALCETIRDRAFPAGAPPAPALDPAPALARCDVALLGGTGFIGAQTVRACLEAGLTVSVMARNTANLPAIFHGPQVRLLRGNINDAAAVRRAIAGTRTVVNLAHGGGGSTWEQVRDAMVGGAEIVARACLDEGVARLIHIGSIASLYLGPQVAPITGATPCDPQAERRGDYARAKAVSEQVLQGLQAGAGLKLVILRPGVVVGEGSSPFHSGLGLFNNDQHCIGWNDGRNPLPFVLASDVADAIVHAIRAEGIDGRCYNLAGDVRPTAREYIASLAKALERPLQFHPQAPEWLWLEDTGKWLIKRATGRKVAAPALRDFLSRGMRARFDCSDAKRDLGWQPVADPATFGRLAIAVHAAPGRMSS